MKKVKSVKTFYLWKTMVSKNYRMSLATVRVFIKLFLHFTLFMFYCTSYLMLFNI